MLRHVTALARSVPAVVTGPVLLAVAVLGMVFAILQLRADALQDATGRSADAVLSASTTVALTAALTNSDGSLLERDGLSSSRSGFLTALDRRQRACVHRRCDFLADPP